MSIKHRSGCSVKRVFYVSACLAVALAACCAALAGGNPSHGVMLDVRDARLAEVVSLLTQQSGVNIFINTDAIGNKKVTARAENISLDKALDLVVKAAAGVNYWKDEDGNYVIGGERPVESKKIDLTEAPVFVPQAETEYAAEPVAIKTETIKLQNSSPEEILVALNVLAPSKDFFGGKVSPVTAVRDYDNNTIEPVGRSLNPRKPARRIDEPAAPAIDPGSSSLDGSAGIAGNETTGRNQYRPPSNSAAAPGRTSAPTQTGANNQNNLLPDGIEKVMPFALDNSLIVRGTEDGIAEFKDIVHLLDIAPKQVMVKAEFIEVSTDDIKRFGIDWSISRLNQSFDTTFNPPGNVIYDLTSGNLTASLRAELTRASGKTINAPIITMLNNEVGQISIERVIPYWTSTVIANTSGNAGNTVAYDVNELRVSTGLSVLPRVNGDGTITLTMAPQVEDTGRIFSGPDGTEIPETRSQSIAIRRRVMNGETIVCGGFIRKNDTFSETKIPILGDLPIVGPLFRSTQRTNSDTELLIFVTPTIIGERSAGSAIGVSP